MSQRRSNDRNSPPGRRAAAVIFATALEYPVTEREAYLHTQCGQDEALRTEVERLLAAAPAATLVLQTTTMHEQFRQAGRDEDRSGTMLSHFRLEKRLGAGGMGEVYRAHDVALGRPVAVKVLRNAVDEDMRKRLVLEARTNARLEHPAIATFFESGSEAGVDFLAMEYVDGTTLRSYLQNGRLEQDHALSVTSTILEAAVHTHAAGIVHRDIKPDNVMVTREGMVKLLDFGIAKSVDASPAAGGMAHRDTPASGLTAHGAIVGTIGYMAPEQIRGAPVSEQTDIFAIGAVLYECLTGNPVFPGAMAVDRIAATMSEEIPMVETAEVEPQINAVIQRALAPDPADRYASARDFLADLRGLASGGTVSTLPNTIAILDLQNPSGDVAEDWIGQGISDRVGQGLARIESLQVVPQKRLNRAIAERGTDDPISLGLSLGCRWVVTGAFHRNGTGVRVEARLVEVATGQDSWVREIDGAVDEILEIGSGLARLIAGGLQVAIAEIERPKTEAIDTVKIYTRAKRLMQSFERANFAEAYDLFLQVLEVDENHAPALARLASAHAPGRWTRTNDPGELETAAEYASRAIEADPDFPTGYTYLAYARWRQGRLEEALTCFDRAIALDPGSWEAHYFRGCCLAQLGRWVEALEAQQRADGAEPSLPFVLMNIGVCLFELGDESNARWTLERAYESEQAGTMGGWSGCGASLAECMRAQGELEAARTLCMEQLELIESRDHFIRALGRAAALLTLGRIAIDQRDAPAANAALDQCLGLVEGNRFLGHAKIQAMAALSCARADEMLYERARSEFTPGDPVRFPWGAWNSDQRTLLELARTARALGRVDECSEFEGQAREFGALRPL